MVSSFSGSEMNYIGVLNIDFESFTVSEILVLASELWIQGGKNQKYDSD